jgi:hypothetical protein
VNLAQAAINGVGSRAGGGGGAAAAVQRGDNGANGDVHDDFDDGEAAARQDFETLSSQVMTVCSLFVPAFNIFAFAISRCSTGGRDYKLPVHHMYIHGVSAPFLSQTLQAGALDLPLLCSSFSTRQ